MVQYYEATKWNRGLKFTANNQYVLDQNAESWFLFSIYFHCGFGSASVTRPRRIRIESPPNILHLRPENFFKKYRNVSFNKNFQTSVQKQYSRDLDPIYPELNRPNPVIRPGQTRSWSAKPAYQRVLNDFFIYRGPSFLAVVRFGSSPPLPSASCPSFSVFLCVAGQAY
jgi:hypothetical protein